MKILAVADLHYALPQFDWLVAKAESVDLVIIAGDLLDLAGFADLDTQIVVVKKYLNRLQAKGPLVVCSGNHDGDIQNAEGEHIAEWLKQLQGENLFVDYQSLEVDGLLISVFPWWDGDGTQREMLAFLDEESAKARDTWLWVYHAPPCDSPVAWTGSKDAGDSVLRGLIEKHQPDYVLSGHIHNSPFFEEGSWVDRLGKTWVFNPGHQIGNLPPSIVLDLDARTAYWASTYGEATIELDAAFPVI
jgi:Icc-related predicted phosphoesterase